MKKIKTIFHYWIAFVSVLAFLGGWVTLAHARKPVQPGSTAPANVLVVPTLAPLQPFNMDAAAGSSTSGSNPAPVNNSFGFQIVNPQPQFGFPVLTTNAS